MRNFDACDIIPHIEMAFRSMYNKGYDDGLRDGKEQGSACETCSYASNGKCDGRECDQKPAYNTEAKPYEQRKKDMERIFDTKEEAPKQDVEKELKKLIDIVMIGSLLKSLNPDDKED